MQLRDYQERAATSVFSYFEHYTGSPLLVLPTAAGKSVILAGLCRMILQRWPNQRLMILSHVKELLVQDFEKIRAVWPGAPVGMYSAGLGQRSPRHPIVVAGIQSAYRKPHVFGHRDLIFIDEAHLLSNDSGSMYRKFITALKEINPRLKVVGLTASPFRTNSGLLIEGEDRLFTDVACEVRIQELLDGGYIAPLVSKSSTTQADLSGVRITGGEYNAKDAEAALDQDRITQAALREALALAGDRRSWLFFCSGVAHAEHVCAALRSRGISAACVTGKTPAHERDRILREFKAGRIRAVTNANVLTTGFDAPNIDLIVLLRATVSPGLFLQMLGRGMRIFPGKTNCLVLDFANNIQTHGPVTHVTPPSRKRGKKAEEEPKVKICELCRTAWPLGTVECAECGNMMVKERDMLKKLEHKASDADVMMSHEEWLAKNTAWVEVDKVAYHRHRKEGSPDSMRVEYRCGMMVYSEWVCLDHHHNFAGKKARQWWNERSPAEHKIPADVKYDLPVLTQHGLNYSDQLATPSRIRVQKDGKYFKILDHDFTGVQHELITA